MKRSGLLFLVWKNNICQAGFQTAAYALEIATKIGGKVYSYLEDTASFLHEAPPGITSPWHLPKDVPIDNRDIEGHVGAMQHQHSRSAGSAFEAKVIEYMALGKSKGEAVRLVALALPHLHQTYMSALEGRGADSGVNMNPNYSRRGSFTAFEAKVSEYMARGMKKAEAVRMVARDFPDLHAAYLSSLGGTTPEAYLA